MSHPKGPMPAVPDGLKQALIARAREDGPLFIEDIEDAFATFTPPAPQAETAPDVVGLIERMVNALEVHYREEADMDAPDREEITTITGLGEQLGLATLGELRAALRQPVQVTDEMVSTVRSVLRQALVDAAHAFREDKAKSSAMFTAETIVSNAVRAALTAAVGGGE